MKYLGYIIKINIKALRVLGFKRRHTTNFKLAPCLGTFYFSLVRPTLDYCTIVQNSFLRVESKLVERVQTRSLSFASFLLLKFHHPQHNYTSVVEVLKLSLLENRRLREDQLFLVNPHHNKVDLSRFLKRIRLHFPNNHTGFRDLFHFPTSRSNVVMNLIRAMHSLNNDCVDIWL